MGGESWHRDVVELWSEVDECHCHLVMHERGGGWEGSSANGFGKSQLKAHHSEAEIGVSNVGCSKTTKHQNKTGSHTLIIGF